MLQKSVQAYQLAPAAYAPSGAYYVPPPPPGSDRVVSLASAGGLEQELEMGAQALELALTSTERLRHMFSSVFRQVKLRKRSPLADAVSAPTGRSWSKGAGAGTPDQHLCESLLRASLGYIRGVYEKKQMAEYLEWFVPGTYETEREVKGCFVEDIPDSPFQRFFFKLGNERIENLLVRALEATGSSEVVGASRGGMKEQNGRAALEGYVRGGTPQEPTAWPTYEGHKLIDGD